MNYQVNQTKALNQAEIKALHAVLERSNQRDATLLWVLLHTGCRASEALNLRIQDFDPRGRTLFIQGLKGSNDREIPIPNWLAKLVAVQATVNSTHIFPISYQRLNQLWLHYRPAKKKLHSLRHSFGIHLYRKTKDMKLVQLALGHKNITNTLVYVDFCYSQQEMRRLIR